MDQQKKALITISLIFLGLMVSFNDNTNLLIMFWFLFIWSLMFTLTLAIEWDLKWNREELEKEIRAINTTLSHKLKK